jgi:hypothetical protein
MGENDLGQPMMQASPVSRHELFDVIRDSRVVLTFEELLERINANRRKGNKIEPGSQAIELFRTYLGELVRDNILKKESSKYQKVS